MPQAQTAADAPQAPMPMGADAGPEPAEKPQMLYVTDLNAQVRHSEEEERKDWRTHTINVDGRPHNYTFKPNIPIEMPYEHGVKFLQDGWLVQDANEVELMPPPTTPSRHDQIVLKPDQVVASLDELTVGALRLRAAQIPGGEKLGRASKEVALAFMLDYRQKTMVKDPNLGEDEEMPDAFLDRVIPKD